MCERRVTKRIKIYDRKCPGLYVSITTAGAATLQLQIQIAEGPHPSTVSASVARHHRAAPVRASAKHRGGLDIDDRGFYLWLFAALVLAPKIAHP
jgi:hypothetical protein